MLARLLLATQPCGIRDVVDVAVEHVGSDARLLQLLELAAYALECSQFAAAYSCQTVNENLGLHEVGTQIGAAFDVRSALGKESVLHVLVGCGTTSRKCSLLVVGGDAHGKVVAGR